VIILVVFYLGKKRKIKVTPKNWVALKINVCSRSSIGGTYIRKACFKGVYSTLLECDTQ